MNYLFKTDGTSEKALPANGTDYTLEELQGMVGGLIEVVRVPNKPSMILIVNEEGLLHNLPPNPMATGIAGQPIVGDAVYCPDEHLK